jgi:uracil-DNA glycosylase family 4
MPSLDELRSSIVACERCTRLRAYCRSVALQKKRAHRNDVYWGRPVPGFGDPRARLLVLGLAPAAHGANRTGRVFTGDGAGGSGDFLMAALHRAGLASLPTSHDPADGLTLSDTYIAAAVRCAPPANKPAPDEIAACLDHLDSEVRLLPHLQVVVALGQVAWNAWLQLLARHVPPIRPKPRFAHGAVLHPSACRPGTPPATFDTSGLGSKGTLGTPGTLGTLSLIGCYHPSRQNTNTGKVTPGMYDEVFGRLVRRELGLSDWVTG